jgi:hypothetical protein
MIKLTITSNGLDCKIIGRSNDKGPDAGKFAKFVLSNILELIALKIN